MATYTRVTADYCKEVVVRGDMIVSATSSVGGGCDLIINKLTRHLMHILPIYTHMYLHISFEGN